jgi:H+/Cl- antiporter ClcA
MKLGPMKGTPKEIRDFCQNNGFILEDYLKKPEKPLNPYLFIVFALAYVVFIILLTTVSGISQGWRTAMFLVGCCFSLCLAVSVQIRFKNTWAAFFIILCGISFMLVALGVISPNELLDQARKLKPK